MSLLQADLKILPEKKDDLHTIYPDTAVKEEVVYRRNGKSIDKVIQFDAITGLKLKATHYDYFDNKKIRSIDEFDPKSGQKLRTINYVLYKSIDEFDPETGKKLRTINFNVKDETRISSIQEYDRETGKIITISIYKRDGKTLSIIKEIDPVTGKVTTRSGKNIENINNFKFVTRSYENIKPETEDIARLIDNLYKNNLKFENL